MNKDTKACLLILGVAMDVLQGATTQKTGVTLTSLVGSCTVTEPVIIELLQSRGLQRLKEVAVGGIAPRVTSFAHDRTRYEHSVGVFMLLMEQNCPLIEQIAGLLHDVSHTAFSHVGDWIFGENSSHESEHLWFLRQTDIPAILERYNICLEEIDPDSTNLKGLEQPLPDMCADRLDYTINTAFHLNFLCKSDVKLIIEHLRLKNGRWFFDNIVAARKLAYASIFCVDCLFGNPANVMAYRWTAQALDRAFRLKLITEKEFRFGTDGEIWEKLQQSNDEQIAQLVHKTKSCEKLVQIGTAEDFDTKVSTKFRCIDPLVETMQGLIRLSALDSAFKTTFRCLKQQLMAGKLIKIGVAEK